MASPEKIAPLLPETLPEDFSDWDSEAPLMPLLCNSGEWGASEDADSFDVIRRPLGPSTDSDAILDSSVDRTLASGSASPPAPAFGKRQEDSIDWDNESSPAPAPVHSSDREARGATLSFGKFPKPLYQSADRNAILSAVVDRSRVSLSASLPQVSVQPQRLAKERADVSSNRVLHMRGALNTTVPLAPSLPKAAAVSEMPRASELTAALIREADEALFQMFQPKNFEAKPERKTARKRWIIVSAICACGLLLLLILMALLFHHGAKSAVNQPVPPPPEASDAQPQSNLPAPSASEPFTQSEPPPASIGGPKTTDNHPLKADARASPSSVQTEMMNDQLTAPRQIPHQIKERVTENGPPSANFGAAGADSMGDTGANSGIFNGHAQPIVKVAPSKPLTISSGVAAGMLIQRLPLVYPPLAKSARVSGTVELHAIISKNGTIKDLQVVSGPGMLRQAAVDAVQAWRYKPYKLNNEPVEVDTTINVVFTLGE